MFFISWGGSWILPACSGPYETSTIMGCEAACWAVAFGLDGDLLCLWGSLANPLFVIALLVAPRHPRRTKKELLTLASARFGASTGTLTRLAKDVLAEELLTMVRNERGHESISRVAEGGRGAGGPESEESGGEAHGDELVPK